MVFGYKERNLKIVGHLPLEEQGKFLYLTSRAQTPQPLRKKLMGDRILCENQR